MERALVGLLCVLPLASASIVRAESAPAPAVGQRVRLTVPEAYRNPLVGTLTGVEPEAVFLLVDGLPSPMRVSKASVTRWELSRGWHSQVGRGATRGLLIGAGAGVVLALANVSKWDLDQGGFLSVVGLGGGIGAGSGALAGLIKTERWEETEQPGFRVGALPVPGGIGFSVRWSFSARSSRAR